MPATAAVVTVTCAVVVALAGPAHAGERQPVTGCAAFGDNVAGLATHLGADFGAVASSVATLFPQAFATIVVRPELAEFCDR